MCKEGATFLLVEKSILLCNTGSSETRVRRSTIAAWNFISLSDARQISQCGFFDEVGKEPACEDERCLSTCGKLSRDPFSRSLSLLTHEISRVQVVQINPPFLQIMEKNFFFFFWTKNIWYMVAWYIWQFYQNEKTVSRMPVPDFSA